MASNRVEGYLHGVEPSGKVRGRSGSGLGALCAEVVGVDGAGIMLMVDGSHRGCLSASDRTMAVVENLQFSLGEGPCIDAFNTQQAVIEPDLGRGGATRWPMFTGPALDAGVVAVFAFPLVADGVCLGAVDLYNKTLGPLDEAQLAEAWGIAGVACDVVLTLQSDTESGEEAAALSSAIAARTVVHQAAGMTAVQLDLSVADALVCLRAHAFAIEQSVNDVGRDVVDRVLRLAVSRPPPP